LDEVVIDDSNDLLWDGEYKAKKFFGLVRIKQGRTRTIAKLLNWFGEAGGF
jgi:hypothetical protein